MIGFGFFLRNHNQPQLVSIHVKPNLCRTVGRVVDSGSVRKLNHAIIALLRTICTFQHSADPNIRRCTRCLVQIQIQREIQKYSTCTFYPCVLTLISAAALFSCRQSAGGLSRAAGSQAKALETELTSKLKLKLKHKLSSED